MGRRRDSEHGSTRPRAGTWLPVLLVLGLLAAAGVVLVDPWARFEEWRSPDPLEEPAAVPPPAGVELPPVPDPGPVARAVPAEGSGEVAPRKVAAALRGSLGDKDLGRHVVGMVGDLSGSGRDWVRGRGAVVPASTTKVLTAVAALEALGPHQTFDTTVVRGRRRSDIVLVGGGDPYLASKPLTPEEADSAYPERADLVTLARRTARSLGSRDRVRLSYDDSLFAGQTWAPSWPARDTQGAINYVDVVSPITALWVDQGRDPGGTGGVSDPAAVAAETFARALARAGVSVVGKPRRRPANEGAEELARVESAPLSDIVERLLEVSDNEAAEVVAHHVGLAVTGQGSFGGGARGVTATLRELGVPTTGLELHDGSGLSRSNRIAPRTLVEALRSSADADHPDLRAALTGLPVAGFNGSLTYRFDTGEDAGLGAVRAKTGTLTGVHSLAGLVKDRDGNTMVFVLAADRVKARDELAAEQVIDELAAALAACRCSA